jgi:Fe2+ or Zn2+ uptake regulation protein
MMQVRNTVQLDIVRGALHELANHPTADEVFGYIHAQHPKISKATVYRGLNKLSDMGQAYKVTTPFGPDRFDHTPGEHAHVQCCSCGRIDDVMLDFGPDLAKQATKASGYTVDGVSVVFLGTCPDCAQN